MIDLSADQLNTIKSILNNYVSEEKVWVFGSRINNTASEFSDLDLVIVGKSKIPQKIYYQLLDAFEESNLSIKVDVLDWHRITSEFQAQIRNNYVELVSPP